MRIAAREWLSTRFEFFELIDRGGIDVAQPDVGRVGEYAESRRRSVVPHCWKTGIGSAASAHLCATAANAPFFEFQPAELAESKLRRELVDDTIELANGTIALLELPGLGVELNEEALSKYQA